MFDSAKMMNQSKKKKKNDFRDRHNLDLAESLCRNGFER